MRHASIPPADEPRDRRRNNLQALELAGVRGHEEHIAAAEQLLGAGVSRITDYPLVT